MAQISGAKRIDRGAGGRRLEALSRQLRCAPVAGAAETSPPADGVVFAKLNFKRDLRKEGEDAMKVLADMSPEERREVHNPVTGVPIQNARLRQVPLRLEENALEFAENCHVRWSNFYDRPGTIENYYPELEAWLEQHLNSRSSSDYAGKRCLKVFAVGHAARNQDLQTTRNGTELSDPRNPQNKVDQVLGVERNVHTDFYEGDEYRGRLVSYLTPGGAFAKAGGIQAMIDPSQDDLFGSRLRKQVAALREQLRVPGGVPSEDPLAKVRLMIVNVWRAIESFPLMREPLAVCDAKTVRQSDLIKTAFPWYLGYDLAPGTGMYQAKYSPDMSWWYWPRMEQSEVIMIKTYDSEISAWPLGLHTSFDDGTADKTAPPRKSCETRCICIMEK